MKITWRRTIIAVETAPEDFIAEDQNGQTPAASIATIPDGGSGRFKRTGGLT